MIGFSVLAMVDESNFEILLLRNSFSRIFCMPGRFYGSFVRMSAIRSLMSWL